MTAIAVIEGVPMRQSALVGGAAEVVSVRTEEGESSKGIYADMSITDAAIHFLQKEGVPQKTGEITKAILAGGQKSESKNPYRMVYNALKHRSTTKRDIRLTDDSMWVLKR